MHRPKIQHATSGRRATHMPSNPYTCSKNCITYTNSPVATAMGSTQRASMRMTLMRRANSM